MQAESRDAGTDPMTDFSSFDPFARGASTTGDYYSAASGLITRKSDYHTALLAIANTNQPILSFRENPPRPVASPTQRKVNAKRNLALSQHDAEVTVEAKDDITGTPRTMQRQALAEAFSTAMTKGVESLVAVKETKLKVDKV